MRITLCICLIISFAVAKAQTHSSVPNGVFTIGEIKGCDDFQVQIKAPACGVSIACAVDFRDGEGFQAVTLDKPNNSVHVYEDPGTYTILLVHDGGRDSVTVTVVENIAPQFQVSNCNGQKVALDVLDNHFDKYTITYGDGQTETTSSKLGIQHVYAAAGQKTVTVRGVNNNAADNCDASTQSVTVADITTPSITTAEVTSDTEVKLDFTGAPNVIHKFEAKANANPTFAQVRSLYNENTFNVSNLNTVSNFYCFRIGAYNSCLKTIQAYSGIVCTSILSAEAVNNENDLSWKTSYADADPSALELEIINKEIGSTSTTTITDPADKSAMRTKDTNVTCGVEYCYRLVMNYGSGKSYSNQRCVTAISQDQPEAITEISTEVTEGAGVKLEWLEPTVFVPQEYHIVTTQRELTSTENKVVDDRYNPESPVCYVVSYVDRCDNTSASGATVCPLRLNGSLTDDNAVNLAWEAYAGYGGGVDHYVVEKYSAGGALLQTIDVTGTTYLDDAEDLLVQSYVYVVKAVPVTAGIPVSVSNRIEVIKNPNLFYPTAFTPNSDTRNDLFNVFGQYITKFELSIFNRWGELMFTTSDIQTGWDGNFRGNPMPEGTYTFVAKITDLAGREFKRSGSFLLLRKK